MFDSVVSGLQEVRPEARKTSLGLSFGADFLARNLGTIGGDDQSQGCLFRCINCRKKSRNHEKVICDLAWVNLLL
jgi:hypothetical protein